MDWSRGETYWGLLGASFMGTLKSKNSVCTESKECGMLVDSRLSEENPKDPCWAVFTPGYHELLFDLGTDDSPLDKVMLRGLNYVPENIGLPETVSLSVSDMPAIMPVFPKSAAIPIISNISSTPKRILHFLFLRNSDSLNTFPSPHNSHDYQKYQGRQRNRLGRPPQNRYLCNGLQRKTFPTLRRVRLHHICRKQNVSR